MGAVPLKVALKCELQKAALATWGQSRRSLNNRRARNLEQRASAAVKFVKKPCVVSLTGPVANTYGIGIQIQK